VPCHPGCFPAGTAIRIPGGTTTIERVQEGDIVITVGPDGQTATAKVEGVFVTRNRLMEVRTEGRTLLTTRTQPLALEGGQYRPAGELKPGDRVWRWSQGKRLAVPVLEVKATARGAQVFNLVLGAPTTFIVGEFLARSKPPADIVLP
jgi:3-dehydroquinate synthase class II